MGFRRSVTRGCRGRVPAMVAVFSIGLAACGSTQNEPTAGSTISTSTSNIIDGDVPDAMTFTAELVGGGTFDGPSTAGRPVVLWFWAPT